MSSNLKEQLTLTRNRREPAQAEFPSARYFQIHFEHLYDELLETRQSMEDLKRQFNALEQTVKLELIDK